MKLLRRVPSVESLFVATLGLFGFRLAAHPISDNSMLLHLRTGMEMAHGRGIPRVDPYSATAAGEPWVVQSWLPELTYGWLTRLGAGWVVLEQAVLAGLLAWLVATLSRTGAALRTLAAAGVALAIGAPYWSPRPLLVGLACMALTVLVVERGHRPWVLIPIVWVWVNSHGSFPLGLAWIAAVCAGEVLDRRGWPADRVRYAGWFVAGLAVSVVNPLGVRLLLFPLTVGDKREVFRTVIEWRTPDFQTAAGMVAAAGIVAAIVLMARSRPPWRDVIPVAAFLALALVAQRNVALLAIVVAPALARALRAPATAPATASPRRAHRRVAFVLAGAFTLFGAGAAAGQPVDVSEYPVGATRWLEDGGYFNGDHHVATQDIVGCWLVYRYGDRAGVFVDDRVDMYPVDVSRDYASLLKAAPGALEVLDRREVDAVLWDGDLPLSTVLALSDQWREDYRRDGWVVFTRSRAGPRARPANTSHSSGIVSL